MRHCLYGLVSHPDVTRFEIEDGILRSAAAELLREESTVDNITIDLGVHLRSGSEANPVAGYDVTMSISGASEADVAPADLGDLVADVAVIKAIVALEFDEISQIEKPWIGTTTPGPKVTAHFAPASGDSSAFRADIRELASSLCGSLGDVGCRIAHIDPVNTWPTNTAISFWFPNNHAAKDAFDGDAFDELLKSTLIDPASAVLVEAIEHRVLPNPNQWQSTENVEPQTNTSPQE